MEYTSTIDIDAPLAVVLKYFGDIKYLQDWQPDLKEIKMRKGEPNEEGSQVELKFYTNGRFMHILETLVTNNLPQELIKVYAMEGVHQTLTSQFEEIGSNKTRWINHNKFEFSGFLAAMASVMTESFKMQSLKNINLFKHFVERMYTNKEV